MLWTLEQPATPHPFPHPLKKKKKKESKQANKNICKRFRSLMLWILEQQIKNKHSYPLDKKKDYFENKGTQMSLKST